MLETHKSRYATRKTSISHSLSLYTQYTLLKPHGKHQSHSPNGSLQITTTARATLWALPQHTDAALQKTHTISPWTAGAKQHPRRAHAAPVPGARIQTRIEGGLGTVCEIERLPRRRGDLGATELEEGRYGRGGRAG